MLVMDAKHNAVKYTVSHLDEQMGPYTEAELKAKWVKGDLLPIDFVYDEAKQDWILMSERFAWAEVKAEAVSPPPLKEVTAIRKQRPPEAPKAIETSGAAFLRTPEREPIKEIVKEIKPGAQVKMVNGLGEIDLSPMQPGQVEVVLQESSSNQLSLQDSLKIQVNPAEPQAIEWVVPTLSAVGQEVIVHVKALDARGELCVHYNDQFVIRVSAPTAAEIPVELRGGHAQLRLNHTRAEAWKLNLYYSGALKLRLPSEANMEWQPGPATRLILDGAKEYTAGHPMKVQVRAVDQYGNLARTFQGTVVLEVKAS